jgi:excisionase family DNA binding protein
MTETLTSPELLTVDEAAAFLRVSRRTIYRRLETGELRAFKAGQTRYAPTRILKDDLVRWLFGPAPKEPE